MVNKPDIPWEVLDEITLASLKSHYEILEEDMWPEGKELIKAIKRVIEYYGGSVCNED